MSTLFSDPSIRDAVVPISVKQYRQMGEDGIIHEKTELIRGVILRKMNKSPLHRWTVLKLLQLLAVDLPEDFFVQTKQPLGQSLARLVSAGCARGGLRACGGSDRGRAVSGPWSTSGGGG